MNRKGVNPNSTLPQVLVMMATYNGSNVVEKQVSTILSQEGVEITLRVSDDQSTDGTFDILDNLSKMDSRIKISRNTQNVGVAENFMQMLYEDATKSFEYFAFSDQDDIWEPKKIIAAINQIRLVDKSADGVLYFSDVLNCHINGKILGHEVYRFKNAAEHRGSLLVNNWAAGCTMVFDKTMLEKIRKSRPQKLPRIHDAWIHMIAKYTNSTIVPDFSHSYILRRITGNNVVGLKDMGISSCKQATSAIRRLLTTKTSNDHAKAAAMLIHYYQNDMSPKDKTLLTRMATYRESLFDRLYFVFSPITRSPTVRMEVVTRLKFLFGRW